MKMNNVGYKQAGVYQYLNQNSSKTPPVKKTISKKQKTCAAIGAAGAMLFAGSFIFGYGKGTKAIKEGEKLISRIEEYIPGETFYEKFNSFINAKHYTQKERDYYYKTIKNYNKYTKNYVGKIRRALEGVRSFIKDTFYNY